MNTLNVILLVALLPFGCYSTVRGASLQEIALSKIQRWEEALALLYEKRVVRYATRGSEFDHIVFNMRETRALLAEDMNTQDAIKKILLIKIVEKSKSRIKREVPNTAYAFGFHGYLFCRLIGMNRDGLLELVGTHEINLDVVLAGVFGGENIEKNDVPPPFEIDHSKYPNDGDPFQKK
jgi:hypothetical protein